MKKFKYIFIVTALIIIYFLFLIMGENKENQGEKPTITVPSSVLEISVQDSKDALLKDVKATDIEDGDLTSQVFIEKVSEFDENFKRTITYGVFDKDDNLTFATRELRYTDYTKPEFDIVKPLCSIYYQIDETYKEFVSASSSVDGDISSKIFINRRHEENDIEYVEYSITDSCGVTETLTLKYDQLDYEPNIDIKLSDYLIKVVKGTNVNAINYIDSIESLGIKNNSLISLVEVETNYNPNVPGVYEFIYRINRSNGEFGLTKLVVIVE